MTGSFDNASITPSAWSTASSASDQIAGLRWSSFIATVWRKSVASSPCRRNGAYRPFSEIADGHAWSSGRKLGADVGLFGEHGRVDQRSGAAGVMNGRILDLQQAAMRGRVTPRYRG